MANLWELDRLNKEKREMEDKSKLIKANHDMKNILNLQVDLCQKRVQAETEAKKSQDLQMLSDWKKKQEAQLQLEAMRREQDRKVRTILSCNDHWLDILHSALSKSKHPMHNVRRTHVWK